MEIRLITRENAGDLRLKNDPFSMPGMFIPALRDGVWTWREELWDQPREMCFPDEPYDFDQMGADYVTLAAYEAGCCLGLAIYRHHFFKYLYLEDLKVSAAARGRGVGRALIEAGQVKAKELGYRGTWATCQDNNLNACRFYLRCGFQIGGFDNRVYTGTSQEGKGDIQLYLE